MTDTITMRCLCCFTYVLLLIFPFKIIKGQPSITSAESSLLNTKNFFQNEIKEYAHLYTGKEYFKYESGIKGFPFFETDQMQTGDIFYDENLYTNVPMLYDIVRQAVVINQYQQEARIQLLTEKIKYFVLNGHRFEVISQAEGEADKISKGLFDVAFIGKASVLIKRIKSIKKGLRAEDPYSFKQEDEYYLKKGRSLYNISDKKAALEVLSDKKDLVRTFIRKNNLKFKKDIEKDLITTAAYYSTLN